MDAREEHEQQEKVFRERAACPGSLFGTPWSRMEAPSKISRISFGLGIPAATARTSWEPAPLSACRKTPALSFEEPGELTQGRVGVALLFKCQIRTEGFYYGRREEGEKLGWNVRKVSAKRCRDPSLKPEE